MSDEKRICKDCGEEFVLTQVQMQRFRYQKPGLRKLVPPVRCQACIDIHRRMVQHLACVTIPIGNALSGEGCYLPLTSADLAEIDSWETSSTNWEDYATDEIPDQPTAIQFNVDQKVAGVLTFTDQGEPDGLIVDAWEFAPWIKDYPDATRAIAYYMVVESVSRGYWGTFRVKADLHQQGIVRSLHMVETSPSSGIFTMPQEIALSHLFIAEEIRPDVIAKLKNRATDLQANLPWILMKMMQKKLTPVMVNEITNARSQLNWNTIRQYEDPAALTIDEENILLNKVQGILGQLAAVEILQQIDPRLEYRIEQKVNNQHVDVLAVMSKRSTIHPCLNAANIQSRTTTSMRLQKGDTVAIEAKAWQYGSYFFSTNLLELEREIRKMKQTFPYILVMVCRDFFHLPEKRKVQVAQCITDAGGLLYVMKGVDALEARKRAGRFLNDLCGRR